MGKLSETGVKILTELQKQEKLALSKKKKLLLKAKGLHQRVEDYEKAINIIK